MKTVFSKTRDVCRLWAAQEQEEARTGSNTRFRRDSLYSYGTAIARIVPNAEGKPVAIVSSSQWSSGTSKVQGEAADEAAKRNLAVFRCPSLYQADAAVQHNINLSFYAGRVADALDKLQRGRASTVASHRSTAKAIIATAENYARTFGIKWTYSGPDPDAVLHASEVTF